MEPAEIKPIEKFVKNILKTRFEDIDRTSIEQAKLRIIDTVGCLIGGAFDPGNPEFIEFLKSQGGNKEATILMYGDRVPVGHAAMANCILCRSFDFEPVSPVVDGQMAAGHVSGTTVMTALSMAEAQGVGGRDLITALLVGDDMTSRVLATSGFSIDLGWDGNGTANAFGATAIAGRLLGLTQDQLRHAMGMVLSQMGGSMQNIWDGTPAFKLPQGLSARNGIFSAQLAAAGWTGPDDALLSPNGYYDLYTRGFSKGDLLTKDLGKKYYADRAIKPYPSCRATHDLIEGAIDMVNQYSLKAGDIGAVSIYMPDWSLNNFCGKPLNIGLFPHSDTAFSYKYTVAVAMMHGGVRPEHFKPEVIKDPLTTEFLNKVELSKWPQSDSKDTAIKVVLKDGREFMETCKNIDKGDFVNNPLSSEEFIGKFMGNVKYSQRITSERGEKIFFLLQDIEELENLDELIELLVP